jgi:hypothetical protein
MRDQALVKSHLLDLAGSTVNVHYQSIEFNYPNQWIIIDSAWQAPARVKLRITVDLAAPLRSLTPNQASMSPKRMSQHPIISDLVLERQQNRFDQDRSTPRMAV